MAAITWDGTGERLYETGVDHGVLYTYDSTESKYGNGVAWNGLTAVTESPSGAEATALWADNIKYANMTSAEEFGGTIEAYTYPDEFMACDGSAELATGVYVGQQNRKTFGLSYRTVVGNDTEGNEHGYKLHLLYGCLASPSEKAYSTISDSPEAITFSWEFTTTAVTVTGMKATACITVDSTKCDAEGLKKLEDTLYGTESEEPYLPMPDEVKTLVGIGAWRAIKVSAESPTATLFGKQVSDLQSNIVIGESSISGTLHHVTDYTEFSSLPDEQSGNYLAIKVEDSGADSTTVKVVNGSKGPVTLDADRNIVLLIKDKDSQSIEIVNTKGEETEKKTYTLTGLTLEDL